MDYQVFGLARLESQPPIIGEY